MEQTEILVCTVCSRAKDRGEGLLPAIRRYRSPRIDKIFALARKEGFAFAILSGEYGLIPPTEPIPYYDKLLSERDIGPIGDKAVLYLKRNAVRRVIYLLPDPAVDPNVIPYLETMRRAGSSTGVSLEVGFVPPYPERLT